MTDAEITAEAIALFRESVSMYQGMITVSVRNTYRNAELVEHLIAAGYLHTGGDERNMFSGLPVTLLLTDAGRSLYTLLKV